MNYLVILLGLNIISIIFILFINNIFFKKLLSLSLSFILLFICTLLWVNFDPTVVGYQYEFIFLVSEQLNIYYHIGVDGLSLFFVILTILLLPICILCSWTSVKRRIDEFLVLLFLITFCVLHVFLVIDLFLFYIFFESVLIPMFLVIGIWGSRGRKIHAAYQFFLYTFVGSLVMLIGLLYMYNILGSTHLYVLLGHNFSFYESKLLWLSLFASFAVKVPMVPVHIWLPEAHVEAPTAGSVILAGILLKMGTYGMLRYSLPIFPEATTYFQPFVYLVSLVSIIYASCTTIRQVDLKKIIAYSSVVHMNFVTLGIVSTNIQGIEGSVLLMLSHGLVSSGLFLLVGFLYDRYGTRLIIYYGGLVFGMPLFSVYFLFFTLSNISLPGTSSFIGEFLVLMACININVFVTIFSCVGVVCGAVYAVWLYNRVVFGLVKVKFIQRFNDLTLLEFYILSFLVVSIVVFGVYPNILLTYTHMWGYSLLERLL